MTLEYTYEFFFPLLCKHDVFVVSHKIARLNKLPQTRINFDTICNHLLPNSLFVFIIFFF